MAVSSNSSVSLSSVTASSVPILPAISEDCNVSFSPASHSVSSVSALSTPVTSPLSHPQY